MGQPKASAKRWACRGCSPLVRTTCWAGRAPRRRPGLGGKHRVDEQTHGLDVVRADVEPDRSVKDRPVQDAREDLAHFAALPAAPPPWATRLQGILWFHRATAAALAQLPPALRSRRRLPLTIGAFVRYLETPVGPYSEVLASPVVLLRAGLPTGHVPFIAVDSRASVQSGRANWALPKTRARFGWEHADAVRGAGEGWELSALAAQRGPLLPFAAAAVTCRSARPGRSSSPPSSAGESSAPPGSPCPPSGWTCRPGSSRARTRGSCSAGRA